jgi:2-deoxy-scyllo-inosamine dehydrogenase (SAM-dependent)/8-amino-3,8-dideoxy-alpha-D-manno-octulosonate transaminase
MKPDSTSLPLFERLQIESQSHCNRSCWFCPRTYDRSGTYLDANGKPVIRKMQTEKILDLLDQALDLGFRGRVGFHSYSEPLLDKRNIELARAARERGLQPYLHTSGDVLEVNEELCRQVVEVYQLVVIGLYDYTSSENLDARKRFWTERLPADRLEFSTIGPEGAKSGTSMGIPRALVPTDKRFAIPDLTYQHASCHRPPIRMIIRYDGEMCNCCEDTFGAFSLGNVYQQSMEELWYSDAHRKIVTDLIAGERENYPLCARCPLPPTAPTAAPKTLSISRRQITEGQVNSWSASKLVG